MISDFWQGARGGDVAAPLFRQRPPTGAGLASAPSTIAACAPAWGRAVTAGKRTPSQLLLTEIAAMRAQIDRPTP
ncbi:MAG: hypothetical protein ACRCU1_14595 [Alsobacter sp.]